MSLPDTNRTGHRPLAGAFAALLVLSAGTSAAIAGQIMPDFELPDVNSTSSTYNQLVSPRDYIGSASAWYFGHAT